jgi:hypothetical protein
MIDFIIILPMFIIVGYMYYLNIKNIYNSESINNELENEQCNDLFIIKIQEDIIQKNKI